MNHNLKNSFQNSWLELIARWILGATFIVASYHKIVEPAQFAKIIYGYYLFPHYSINLIAIILPFIEIITGIALVLGIYPRSASLILNIILFTFIIAVSINIARGHEFDCGCFAFGDTGDTSSAVQLLIRDIILFVLGLQIIFYDNHRKLCSKQNFSTLKNS